MAVQCKLTPNQIDKMVGEYLALKAANGTTKFPRRLLKPFLSRWGVGRSFLYARVKEYAGEIVPVAAVAGGCLGCRRSCNGNGGRGQCKTCYQRSVRRIKAGETTWQELEDAGLANPPQLKPRNPDWGWNGEGPCSPARIEEQPIEEKDLERLRRGIDMLNNANWEELDY
jgi:hypothetical protein